MSEHKIVRLPNYWTNTESETYFNDLGSQGWDLHDIKNLHAYFIQHSTPVRYKFVKNDNYLLDVENTLNTFGSTEWILVLVNNGYSILKQIVIA